MEVRHLRYFTAVVEAGSFTAAAAALHMSQPPLSHSIAQLEKELGVVLLERSSKGIRPTGAGRHLLTEAKRIVDDVARLAPDLARFAAADGIGRISLAAIPSLLWRHVPALLATFGREWPHIGLHLIDVRPAEGLDLVAERTVDLSLVATSDLRSAREQYPLLELVVFAELELVLLLPPQMTDLPDPVDLAVLEDCCLVTPAVEPRLPGLPELVDRSLAEYGVRPSTRRTVNTSTACLPLVRAGMGVAVVPVPTSEIAMGVRVRRPRQSLPALDAVAGWRKDVTSTPAVSYLRAQLRNPPEPFPPPIRWCHS